MDRNLGAMKELDEQAEEQGAKLEVRCKKFLEAMQEVSSGPLYSGALCAV